MNGASFLFGHRTTVRGQEWLIDDPVGNWLISLDRCLIVLKRMGMASAKRLIDQAVIPKMFRFRKHNDNIPAWLCLGRIEKFLLKQRIGRDHRHAFPLKCELLQLARNTSIPTCSCAA